MKKQLAIIGACCSRDMCNSQFVIDWKEHIDLVYYAFQTSFISLTSTPVPYSRKLIQFEGKNYSSWYRDILIRELNKSFLNDLLSLSPDNLLIDFYSDVVMGVLEINGQTYITQRLKDQKNNAAFHEFVYTRTIKPLTDYEEYMQLWRQSVNRFLAFMRSYLPNTRIVLNVPQFSDEILYSDGRIEKYNNKDVSAYNRIYHEMVSYVKENDKNVVLLELSKKYFINPEYVFGGAWIVHFHNDYYQDIVQAIDSLCVNPSETISKQSQNNLVINGSFRYGSLFYKYWDKQYFISYEDGEAIANIRETDNEKEIWAQAWCCDIPLDGGGKESYTVSFDCKVSSEVQLSNKTIFVIRTFDKQNCISRDDCIEQVIIPWNGKDLDVFSHYSITIKPKGKFMSVGLYCTKNGCVSYKNICVYHSEREPKFDYMSCNLVEKILVGSKKLLDVNKLKLIS